MLLLPTLFAPKLLDFVHQFHTQTRTIPCSPCGSVHLGQIHGYVERKYRDREHQENLTILIPVIICPVAPTRGAQYAKRLLREFLILHSVIRLDHLLEVVDLPEIEPETPPGVRLMILFDAEIRAGERAGEVQLSPPLWQLLQAAMGKSRRKKPLNRASALAQPP